MLYIRRESSAAKERIPIDSNVESATWTESTVSAASATAKVRVLESNCGATHSRASRLATRSAFILPARVLLASACKLLQLIGFNVNVLDAHAFVSIADEDSSLTIADDRRV